VNLASALLLRDHEHESLEHAEHHHDHNLRGAYLHVLADALTSVLAIVALVAGKALGWTWMDPATGLVGSLVIARWSWGLLRDTSRVLLDAEVSDRRSREIQRAIEADADNRIADLHLWRVGPEHLAAIISVVTHEPRDPAHYKRLLAGERDLVHVTVEVQACRGDGCLAA
jgi:cation diffusion facilitator family transporter